MQVLKSILLSFLLEGFILINCDSFSSGSMDPSRICVCDSEGVPQCADKLSSIFMSREVYPGETITISVVVVGEDFGTTVGTVYAGSLDHDTPLLMSDYQHSQEISDLKCTDLNYTLYGDEGSSAMMHLSTLPYEQLETRYQNKDDIKRAIATYHNKQTTLLTTLVFIDVKFLPCPPGFSHAGGHSPNCECNPVFHEIPNIKCEIFNGIISFAWSGKVWIGFEDNTNGTVLYSVFCPFCTNMYKQIDFQNKDNFDIQCEFNRKGKLCGICKDNYSLAIGSSHCIKCSNNNNFSLVIFFAFAGFLLIFFISILNLTVSQGMINGLIFYTNIIWGYQGRILPYKHIQIFVAWLNLDFGIETCFVNHLNFVWKTWLQFVFPIYTASLFLIGLSFSSKLSKLFGDRSVPTLATLLFLSYSDLLRTIIAALGFTIIHSLSDNSTESPTVWSADGSVEYGTMSSGHIFLVLAALICFLFWLLYTLLLLFMQWLRKMPHSRLSQWITRYKPVFDAYYAPLNDKRVIFVKSG